MSYLAKVLIMTEDKVVTDGRVERDTESHTLTHTGHWVFSTPLEPKGRVLVSRYAHGNLKFRCGL